MFPTKTQHKDFLVDFVSLWETYCYKLFISRT